MAASTDTVASLKRELRELREAVSGLIDDYKDDLCEEGLGKAKEVLKPLGVKFPTRTFRVKLGQITVEGVPDGDGFDLSGVGSYYTTDEFDRAFVQAVVAKVGERFEFDFQGSKVVAFFRDAEVDDSEDDTY